MGVIQGKLLAVSVNGTRLDCQTAATLNFSVETEENDPCKPAAGGSAGDAQWADPTEGSRSWTIDFSAKAFADSTGFNQADLIDLFVDGSVEVNVLFSTTQTTDYDHPEVQVLSGTGIMSDFSWDAPATGESTYDVTITGKGKPTWTRTPVTT